MFGFGNKNKINKLQNELHTLKKEFITKSWSFYDAGFLSSTGQFEQSILEAIRLYEQCAPLYMVIDKIVSAYNGIPFRVRDIKTGEFIDDHEILELLNNPNGDETSFSFKDAIASSFLITGNLVLIATGNINKPPLEIYNISPRFINPIIDSQTDFNFSASKYLYTAFNQSLTFKSNDKLGVRRYYNDDIRELYHIKQYNPSQTNNSLFGMSKVYPLLREIEQYVSANVNNISLLKNGGRLSGVLQNNRGEELTESQFERIKQEAEKFSGSQNSGKIFVSDGMEWKEVGQTNRDMQFKEMQDAMIARIANVYGVPLALLLDSTMTLNNLQTARLHLDKDAVIPLATRINKELTKFLMPRYQNSENLELSIDVTQIESLKPEALSNAQLMAATKVNTINEIRSELGYEPIEDGDKLIGSSSGDFGGFDFVQDETQSDDDDDSEEKSAEFTFFKENMEKSGLDKERVKALWLLTRNM